MVGIVDYGSGNVGSISNMFRRAGVDVVLCALPSDLASCDRIVLPGVGAFDPAMERLISSGFRETLAEEVAKGKPILGICLGMQLLTSGSDEGKLDGLGQVAGFAHRFPPLEGLKVPHMGWNFAQVDSTSPLFAGMEREAQFYFLHSYYVVCEEKYVISKSTYGFQFVSGFSKENVFGVQFHPEKSHRFGLQLFRNFSQLPA